ncbi:MAG: DEAD/DEAH box helicase [Rhodothermales bacterium]
MTTFHSLGLSDSLLRGVVDAGYTTPTPIQAAAIPTALSGRDLTGCAQTGTGKTAAFVLPMLDRLAANPSQAKRRPVRALVVAPTRELALQVEAAVRTYGKFTGLRSVAIFGGVGMGPQLQALQRGVDIVSATPGRLLDHIGRGTLDLSRVEVLVLDEADRMFDMGFINDVRKIVAKLPRERQTLLFSATMPPAIQELAASIQRKPEFVEVGQRRNPAESVTQYIYPVAQTQKMDLLLHVLQTEAVENVLVFSRTKHRANRITKKLEQRGFAAAAIHSNRSQNQRQRALADFKRGDVKVLVATDIAARGIDVDGISHVVNFDTPNMAEDYIHRIGRTGRADATGDALTFVSADEEDYLRNIEKHTGRRFERSTYADFDYTARGEAEPPPARSSNGRGGSSSRNGGRPKSQGGGQPKSKQRRRR